MAIGNATDHHANHGQDDADDQEDFGPAGLNCSTASEGFSGL